MLSDEEAAGLTQPLASAPTSEERRTLRRSGTRDRNKRAAACFLLSAGDYACADGSVRKGMAPQAGQVGSPHGAGSLQCPPQSLRPWPLSPLPWLHPHFYDGYLDLPAPFVLRKACSIPRKNTYTFPRWPQGRCADCEGTWDQGSLPLPSILAPSLPRVPAVTFSPGFPGSLPAFPLASLKHS